MGDVARRLKTLQRVGYMGYCYFTTQQDSQILYKLEQTKGFGQIAEAADVVMFVYRPEVYGKFYPEPFANTSTSGAASRLQRRNIGLLKLLRIDADNEILRNNR